MNHEPSTPSGDEGNAARWVAVFEAAVHAVITIDRRGRIDGFNHAAERLFGRGREAVLGRNVNILMPQPDAKQHDGYLERYQASGDPRIIGTGREVTAVHADGSPIPIHLSVGEFRVDETPGYVAVIHDLTAQKQAESLVKERDQVLRLTFEEAPLASATLDTDGKIITINRAFQRLLGWNKNEAAGRMLADLICGTDEEVTFDDTVRERPCRIVGSSGQEHEVILHLNVVEDAEGSPSLLVAQFEDHTERLRAAADARAARDRLARVDRISMIGEMASGIAHEVNQPLSAIANYSRALSRMMEQQGIDDADLLETANKLHLQAHRAGEIIRRIRGFVSKNPGDAELLDVNAVIEEAVALAEIDGMRHKVGLELRLGTGLPPVLFDRIQFQQVVLNLIRNAIEASVVSANGPESVRVRTLRKDDSVCTEVRDRGKGISEDDEARLFEPFFSTKRDGMGMGLAICRSIVEMQGGRLSFTRNSDRGVTFRIQVPVASGDPT